MRFRRRNVETPARREAGSIDELIQQIAEDKSRSRFKAVPPGTERPRDVFMASVGQLVEPLVDLGFKYAKSGPHATRREGHVRTKVYFSSSSLNVSGESVSLHIAIGVHDASLGSWRKEQPQPRRADDVVATRHLGHFLDPPVWLEWNLADPRRRRQTLEDVAESLLQHGLPLIDRVTRELNASEVAVDQLRGLVDDESLVEYYIRANRKNDAGRLVSVLLDRYHDRGREHFESQVRKFRSEGLPDVQSMGISNGLAYLVVCFQLPVAIAD